MQRVDRAKSLCPIQIFSMYWAVSLWLEVRWCQLQFMKKLFWSQPKIIDQSHCFQLWAKLRNAVPVRGFITTSNSQLLLYNTDSCVPLRVLRNVCLYSIQSGEALDKNKQTNIFLPRLSTPLIISFFLKRWDGAASQVNW